ncbi:amino acid transporter [Xylariaceae sp. FL0804]|nr:amino acid transporter [Xylariaceae sp. FL0804]
MKSLTQSAALLLAVGSAVSASPMPVRRQSSCAAVGERVPWTNLTATEKSDYIQADLCLMSLPSTSGVEGAVTRWDDLQWPHIIQTITVHNVGAFLPFHRYYMTVHERMVREECGYTGRMAYWDEVGELETLDSIADSELWSTEYFGGNGSGDENCITDGPFVNLTLRFNQDGSATEKCLTRIFSQSQFSTAAQDNIDECNAIDNYTEAWDCWSRDPHSAGHGGVGGIMSDATLSPGDPVFYLHHSYLDKLFWEWQNIDIESRLTDMGGPNIPAGENPRRSDYPGPEYTDYFGDGGGNVTTLNHTLFMTGLYANLTIGDVMDLNGAEICAEYL